MTKNMFVFVTENGTIYDRTNSKNLRLFTNKRYELEVGTVEFTNKDSQLFVTRYTGENKEIYKREITASGLYLISAVFIQPMPKSPKELRTLYNRLKETLGKPCFKVETNTKIRGDYSVKLHTWLDKGFKFKFTISVKNPNVSKETLDTIINYVDRASKLDLRSLLEYYGAFHNTGVSIPLNEGFFRDFQDHLQSIQREARVAQQA